MIKKIISYSAGQLGLELIKTNPSSRLALSGCVTWKRVRVKTGTTGSIGELDLNILLSQFFKQYSIVLLYTSFEFLLAYLYVQIVSQWIIAESDMHF